jgi:hypothetical protein
MLASKLTSMTTMIMFYNIVAVANAYITSEAKENNIQFNESSSHE